MLNKKIVTFAVFLAIGLGVAAVGYGDITGQVDFTKSYDQVDAEITDITYESYVVQTGPTKIEGTDVMRHQPKVEYMYLYEGESYTNELRLTPYRGSIEDTKQQVAENYNVGDEKTLYVSERSPKDSMQSEPNDLTSYLLVAFGLIISLCTILLGNRSRKA